MKPNYRVITVSTRDGSLFDIAEFINYADVLAWRSSGRFMGNLHTIVVAISSSDPSMHYVICSGINEPEEKPV